MRLIDADSLLNRMTKAMESGSNLNGTFHLYIEHAPTIQRPTWEWIPCSERLPEEYGEYLVTKRTIGWNCEEYGSNDIAYFDSDGFHKADKVTAWMSLPEPYKGGGTE